MNFCGNIWRLNCRFSIINLEKK